MARDAHTAALEACETRIYNMDQRLTERLDNLAQTVQSIGGKVDAMATQMTQLAAQVEQTSRNIDRMTSSLEKSIDRLANAVEADRQSVQQLIVLAAEQQRTFRAQQETLNLIVQQRMSA